MANWENFNGYENQEVRKDTSKNENWDVNLNQESYNQNKKERFVAETLDLEMSDVKELSKKVDFHIITFPAKSNIISVSPKNGYTFKEIPWNYKHIPREVKEIKLLHNMLLWKITKKNWEFQIIWESELWKISVNIEQKEKQETPAFWARATFTSLWEFWIKGFWLKITELLPNGLAKKSGFEVGDAITQIDGKNVSTEQDYSDTIDKAVAKWWETIFRVYDKNSKKPMDVKVNFPARGTMKSAK